MAHVRVTPDQATQKWVSRLGAATQEIQQGIQGVQTAPGQQAAAKFDKWLNGVQASAQKWRRNVAAVSLEDWKSAAINVGVPRIAQGAQAKQGKYTRFAAEFFPHLEAGVQKVKAMPDTDLNSRIQRAVAMMQHNANFKRGGGN